MEATRATGNTDTILTVLSWRFCRQGQSTVLRREGPANGGRKKRVWSRISLNLALGWHIPVLIARFSYAFSRPRRRSGVRTTEAPFGGGSRRGHNYSSSSCPIGEKGPLCSSHDLDCGRHPQPRPGPRQPVGALRTWCRAALGRGRRGPGARSQAQYNLLRLRPAVILKQKQALALRRSEVILKQNQSAGAKQVSLILQ